MQHTNTPFFNTLVIALLAIMLLNGCKKENSATCTDGTKNGTETGVDCGGSCNACAVVAPVACFNANRTTASIAEEFIFTNCSTGATSYAWSFGDGQTSTLVSPSHRYLQSGTYVVSLSAINADTTTIKTMAIYISVNSATYAGNYHVTSSCTQKGNTTYDATIAPSGGSTISLSNFYDSGETIQTPVSGYDFTITNKAIYGWVINGSGTLSSDYNTVNMTYTVVGGPTNDNCTVVYTRF